MKPPISPTNSRRHAAAATRCSTAAAGSSTFRYGCAVVMTLTLMLVMRYTTITQLNSSSSSNSTLKQQGEREKTTSGSGGSPPPHHGKRPNILIITTDQQRWDTLSRVQSQLAHYRNKLHISTPHLDRLADRGTLFWNAYCQSPSCAPARSSLRTGCSTARTGVRGNKLLGRVGKRKKTKRQLATLYTYDQILVQRLGYVAETYGKKHLPNTMLYQHASEEEPGEEEGSTTKPPPLSPVLQYDNYDLVSLQPNLTLAEWQDLYPRHLEYLAQRDNLRLQPRASEQTNDFSHFPYTPVALDSRYGEITLGSKNVNPQSRSFGKDSLGSNHTATALIGQMGLLALERLGKKNNNIEQQQQPPFCLTISFHSPHPPFVATEEYLDKYWDQRNSLYLPKRDPNMHDNSPYYNNKLRITKQMETPSLIAEWTAIYYALISEVDTWIGRILDKLDDLQLTENTLIVFTSDHGEMLGAHGLSGKNTFYEEATRVPLIMSYPGRIPSNHTIHSMANHVDMVATILDYIQGGAEYDTSDGTSLRPILEQRSYNEHFDEDVAISESVNMKKEMPNYMVRKGSYKLMIAKNPNATTTDMFVDLAADPFETNNWIAAAKMVPQVSVQSIDTRAPESPSSAAGSEESLSLTQIGKIEHLKAILIDWMKRADGEHRVFSKPADKGPNEIRGVKKRRTWSTVDYWVSDDHLVFGQPVLLDDQYVRNEYLYIGRTNLGDLNLSEISVQGADAHLYTVSDARVSIPSNDHLRLRVTFRSNKRASSVDARIVVQHDAGPDIIIKISH